MASKWRGLRGLESTGHGVISQAVCSDARPSQAAPPWAAFAVLKRVRVDRPSPQGSLHLAPQAWSAEV